MYIDSQLACISVLRLRLYFFGAQTSCVPSSIDCIALIPIASLPSSTRRSLHRYISRAEAESRITAAGDSDGLYLLRAKNQIPEGVSVDAIVSFAVSMRLKDKYIHRLVEKKQGVFTVDRKSGDYGDSIGQVVSSLCEVMAMLCLPFSLYRALRLLNA